MNFEYNRPNNTFDASRVKGVVAKLIQIKEKFHHYATAVEVCAAQDKFWRLVKSRIFEFFSSLVPQKYRMNSERFTPSPKAKARPWTL